MQFFFLNLWTKYKGQSAIFCYLSRNSSFWRSNFGNGWIITQMFVSLEAALVL